MQPKVQMRDVWTIEDLDTLDVEDWNRYEIVDGALVVSPPPGLNHEFVVTRVRNALIAQAPSDVEVLAHHPGIGFGRSYRIPDLALVHTDALRRGAAHLRPADVLLAVEVVSPGSVTTDRITKSAQYAAAGIPAYWRVETDPVSLTVYELPIDATTYVEAGTWSAGDVARVAAPFPVEIELDRLV